MLTSVIYAQQIDKATGAEEVSADSVNGGFTTLDGPVITETSAGQLSLNETLEFTLPTGWEWDTTGTDPSVTITLAPGNNATTHLAIEYTSRTSSKIIFTITQTSDDGPQKPGRATFSNFRIRPTTGILPNSGTITNTGSTGPRASTSYGDLGMKEGTNASISVETKSDGTGQPVPDQNLSAGGSITVYAISRDQYGNFLENIAADEWTLPMKNNLDASPLTAASDGKSAVFSSNATGSAQISAHKGELPTSESGTITVQPGSPSSLAIQTQPSSTVTAGQAFTQQPVVDVLDVYGNRVENNHTIEVTAARRKGSGTLQGTTSVTVQQGRASFTDLKHNVAAVISLEFTADNLNKTTSDDITVSPGAASQLVFSRPPSNGSRNTPLDPPPVVQIADQFGNYTSQTGTTIEISKDTGPGGLTGTTSQTADSSVSFSDLSFDTNGSYTIQVSDAAAELASAISDTFNIFSPGDLARFSIKNVLTSEDIASVTAGESFSIEIKALDGAGNQITDFNESVVLTSNGDMVDEPDTTNTFLSGLLASHNVQLTSAGEFHITTSDTARNPSITSNSSSFTVQPGPFDTGQSTISSDKSSITANGISQVTVTVRLKDQHGNELTTGGENVVISTSAGSLSNITDNQDGTYSAVLTSSTSAETAIVTATVNDSALSDEATVHFTSGTLSKFAVEHSGGGSIPDQTAGESFDIRIVAQDEYGNTVTDFTGSVNIEADLDILSGGGITGNFSSGVLTSHTIAFEEAGTATITVTNESGSESGTSAGFTVNPASATSSNTTIRSVRRAIQNNGTDSTEIIVQLKDQYGNNLTSNSGGYSVILATNLNSEAQLSSTSDNSDGTFSATLTSTTIKETVTVTGTLDGTSVDDTASVVVTEFNTWQSSGGGGGAPLAWEDPSNWSLQSIPTSEQLVIIPTNPENANRFPIIQSNPTISFLEVQSDATVNVDPGYSMTILNDVIGDGILIGDNSTFTIHGDIAINEFTAGTSTVTLSGSSAQQIPGQLSTDLLNIENTDGISSSGYIDANTLNINNSTLTMEEGSRLVAFGDVTGNGNLITDKSSVTLQGDVTVDSVDVSSSDVIANGVVAQTINTIDVFGSLTVSNTATGGVTLTTAADVVGTLTISSSATLIADNDLSGSDLSASGATLKLGGDLNFTSVSVPPSTVEFIGNREQDLIDFETFNNLTINKTDSNVTASSDLVVNGTLTLTSGSLTMASGTNLLAPNQNLSGGTINFQLELPSRGWYALSSPVASTYDDFLDSVVTQGYPGAYYSTGSLPGDTLQPNVLYYDETYSGTDNQRWRTLGNATDSVAESRGHFVYLFGDIPEDDLYSNTTPRILEVQGNEFDGDGTNVDFNVTYTALGDTGWNLVGNPFGATIDWDDSNNWTKTNIDQTIYVWDHTANNGNGEYLVWNGFTGSLGNGLLAPFQGFWVKANAPDPILTVHEDIKTSGGIYRKTLSKKKEDKKEEVHPIIEFKLESGGLATSSFIAFSENASRWQDSQDAFRLTPFTDTFVQMFSTLDDGTQLKINNLPRKFGRELEIPVHVGGLKNGNILEGAYTITWPGLEHIPSEWQILLEDRYSGKTINLKREDFYSFDVKASGKKTSANGHLAGQYSLSSRSDNNDARFILRIDPRGDAEGIPSQLELSQNYPNPFGQSTTIRFGLPEESRVKLTVYDILGRKVAVLAQERFEAGYHTLNWNAKALASGVYLYVLQTDEKVLPRKMTLIK